MQQLRQGQAINGPDGVYMVVVPPADNQVNNIPTNRVAVIGTAPYGPVNTPVPVGSSGSLKAAFVGLGLGVYDLATDLAMCLKQGTNNLLGVRVTDGTDAYAAANLVDGSAGVISKDTAFYTGTGGNGFTRKIEAGSNNTNNTTPTSFKVTVTRPGYQPEVFDNIPATGFQSAYVQAINQGQAGFRGPSQLIKAALPTVAAPTLTAGMFTPSATGGTLQTGVIKAVLTLVNAAGETVASNEVSFTTTANTSSCAFAFGTAFATGVTGKLYITAPGGAAGSETFAIAVPNTGTVTITAPPAGGASAPPTTNTATIANANPPAVGTATFAGGTDGASGVTTTTMVGTDGMGPARTGMYALRSMIGGGAFFLAGTACCDTTTWSNMATFGQSESAVPCFGFPLGTSTSAAQASKQAAGVSDWQAWWFKDWFWIQDTDNAVQRYVSPVAVNVGFIMNLSSEQSPANKPMTGFIGTERTLAGVPYDATEALTLENAGIMYCTNPISYGAVFGLAHGRNGSTNPTQNQVSYTRMTLLISLSLGAALGKFVGKIQSQRSDDPSRRQAENLANTYMQALKTPRVPGGYGMIDDYKNIVDSSINTPTTIGQGLAFGYSMITYLGVIEKFIWSIQGGNTVQITKA